MRKTVSIIILISLIVAVLPLAQASENATVGSENESMTVTLFPLSDGCFSTVPEKKQERAVRNELQLKQKMTQCKFIITNRIRPNCLCVSMKRL